MAANCSVASDQANLAGVVNLKLLDYGMESMRK